MKDKIRWQKEKKLSLITKPWCIDIAFLPLFSRDCSIPRCVCNYLFVYVCVWYVRVAFMYSHCECVRARTLLVCHTCRYNLSIVFHTLLTTRLRITHRRIEKGEKHAKWNRHSLVHSQETEPTKRKIRKSYRWIF